MKGFLRFCLVAVSAGLLIAATTGEPAINLGVPPPVHPPTAGRTSYAVAFNGQEMPSFNTTFWWGGRWINNQGEQEVYVDPSYRGTAAAPLHLNPFSVRGGALRIQAAIPSPAIAASLEGQHFTSGLVTTYDSFQQRYGYFEIRARIPSGKGYWPTFWLLPKVDMPHPPEIDILEAMGDRTTALLLTAHYNDTTGTPQKTSFTIAVPDMSAGFHRYGLLWTHDVLAWYFDGERVAYTATPVDLHAPMYFLLNLAVGSNWGSEPDATTKFPGAFAIEYIKVYPVQ